VKPSIEYLNSLNEYRKRSRSTDDVGIPVSSSGKKVARMDLSVAPPIPRSSVSENTQVEHVEMDSHSFGNDPLVYVNGESMLFSQVSEEHHELMTPEEYAAYFEVFQSQNS